MTLPVNVAKVRIVTPGGTAGPFNLASGQGALYANSPADLVVTHVPASGPAVPLVYGADYTIGGNITVGTGTLTATAVLPAGVLTARRSTAIIQQAQWRDGDGNPSARFESTSDYGRLIDGELSERISRAVSLRDTSDPAMDPTLPDEFLLGAKLLVWDPAQKRFTVQDPMVVQAQAAAAQALYALGQVQSYALPHAYVYNFFDVIADNAIIAQIRAGTYAGNLDAYWATAMGLGRSWFLPEGTYNFANALVMREGLNLIGASRNGTIINSAAVDVCFKFQNGNGIAEIEGPKIRNLTLNVNHGGAMGIQLNSIGGGFTDDVTTQNYMMRPVLQEVTLIGTGTGIAVQWCKSFDGQIEKCLIQNFATLINFEGSDICTIRDNRLAAAHVQGILLSRHGTFGSSTMVQHNDILGACGTNGSIVAGDNDVKILDNYFETIVGSGTAVAGIVLNGGLHARVCGNRIEFNSGETYWLSVTQDSYWRVEARGNATSSNTLPVKWGANGSESIFASGLGDKRSIIHDNNIRDSGFPWNDAANNDSLGYKEAFRFGPGRVAGVSQSDYGATLRAKAVGGRSAYIIPYIAGFGSLTDFDVPDYALIGTYNIEVEAFADNPAQILNWQLLDGGAPIQAGTVVLTTSPKSFTIAAAFAAAAGLQVKLWNNDNAHGNSPAYVLRVAGSY